MNFSLPFCLTQLGFLKLPGKGDIADPEFVAFYERIKLAMSKRVSLPAETFKLLGVFPGSTILLFGVEVGSFVLLFASPFLARKIPFPSPLFWHVCIDITGPECWHRSAAGIAAGVG